MNTTLRLLLPFALLAALSACVSQSIKSTSVPAIDTASSTVPEKLLLDVGVQVFDPGIEDYDATDDELVYPEVRRAEARYMPGLLVDALQNSGAWGAVRVIPNDDQFVDLRVAGEILHSDGEFLELAITATDARGTVWLDRTYSGHASSYAYEPTTRNPYDPFQGVYHRIANDLLQQLEGLQTAERERIRLVTELLFARSFAPEAFSGYLEQGRKDVWMVRRLPAENDPMLQRVREIRERDRMFIDTLQEYYNSFDLQMSGPYQEWRKLSYQEVIALEEVRSESRRRLLTGAAAILGGILAASSGESGFDGAVTRTAGHVAILGGGYLLKSGLERRAEAQIHVEALEELGLSLEAEITPQVIDLEDRTVTLNGSVEEQYAQWRDLLAEIYRAEIGELAVPAETAAATDTL
ncbi:MAG: hypothetical protein U5K56_08860 [Halioglobus sp.]|nr:hypothetical protein [Halioglobus sp.]